MATDAHEQVQPAGGGNGLSVTRKTQDCELVQLLHDLSSFIRRFVALSPAQADVCGLWAIHTHVLDTADFTPYLDINSPVLRSGKTRLLEVLRLLVHNPWFTGRVTGSALVRKIDKDHPTLLLDESDAAFQTRGEYSEVLRGILNAGFERDGTYSMSVQKGNDWEPRDFKTFSAKAIAGIGHLPATIRDRSLPIRLKRAKRADSLQRFRKRKVRPEGEQLRQRIEKWAKANTGKLRDATAQLPDQLNDRQQDVCEPLLAIADVMNGCWPARARNALVELCSGVSAPDDSSGVRLLADIRQVFADSDRLSTCQLLEHLCACEDSPWSEIDHGCPLSAYRLSQLLRPFDVRPHDIRFEDRVKKGYLRSEFGDAWERYLGQEGQQGQQGSVAAGLGHFSERQHASPVAVEKSAKSPANTRVVADVAPSSPLWSELGDVRDGSTNREKSNGARHCRIHPANKTDWWLRGIDPVCGICHPNPSCT